ncbi:hypothetical protein ACOME3_005036 [Neoechinorhynchus agilis]
MSLNGLRQSRPSLRNLAAYHLGITIQRQDGAHNPVEDARAAMELAQWKMKNGIRSGDACLEHVDKPEGTLRNVNDRAEVERFVYNTGTGVSSQFFSFLRSLKCVFIGQSNRGDRAYGSIESLLCESNRQVCESFCDIVKKPDKRKEFTICQFYGKLNSDCWKETNMKKIMRYIKRCYSAMNDNELLVSLFVRDETASGLCFATVKNLYTRRKHVIDGIEVEDGIRL